MVNKLPFIVLWTSILFLPKLAIAQDLKIAVASSLIGVMEDLVAEVHKEIDIHIEIVPGASGTLTHQIINGAPYDILIAADNKYCRILEDQEISRRTFHDVIRGQLILWSNQPLDSSSLVQSILLRLNESANTTLAIANPKIAPYGYAANAWLEHHRIKEVIPNLIIGNSVSLVNQYIFTKAVDMVITAKSSSYALETGYWYPINLDQSMAVEHCIAYITSDPHINAFNEVIFGTELHDIWLEHGYTYNERFSSYR